MTSHDFDEKLLFERKAHFCGFRFCPQCGSPFMEKEIDGRVRLQCTNESCNYIYYHNPIPAAGAMVVRDNNILLVKRSVQPKMDWWCLPAGFMEWNEHPAQTAIRELREETGLDIHLDGLFEVYSGEDDPRTNAVLILYRASVAGGTLRPGDDAREAVFFAFDAIPDKIAFVSHRQALADYRSRFSL
ncbi:MAG: NUDIX hydrolase [candidate division Zixibacteria bacterium]|nr:NUDIX hydrolase [candidate division Zixibacteria bacterium]